MPRVPLTLSCLLAALLAPLSPLVHAEPASPPAWQDQAVFRVNKEAPRAVLMPFPFAEAATTVRRLDSPWALTLNGDWSHNWSPTDAGHPAAFWREDFEATGWGSIPVPANVELHGHGTPIYSNITYPFKVDPPRTDGEPAADWTAFKERSPVSAYRRTFRVPAAWEGRRVFIVFNGVSSSLRLWLNGREVGYSEDSRTPAEFDLTPYLKTGDNLLAAEVRRFSDGAYLEDQDFWRLSGIFRDVYLWSADSLDLRDLEVSATLSDDFARGALRVKLSTRNRADRAQAYGFASTLLDSAGRVVATGKASGTASADGEHVAEIRADDLAISAWSAESPTLYTLLLRLTDGQGKDVAFYSRKIGFRRSEIRDGQLLVNGRPVLIKGVNRHDHDHLTGHYVPEATMRAELDAMKRLNINAIRTSHYPNEPRFLELVDEYGFYVVSEANIETHGFGTNDKNLIANDASWRPALLDRVRNTVELLKNHPSIVLWSLGNEAGTGPNFEALARWVKDRDPSRPLHYEGAGERDYVDLYSPMYFRIDRLEEWCRKQERLPLAQQRPLIQCEFNHTMGNSSGGFDEYWAHIRRERLLQGGFVWDWRDQGIARAKPASPTARAAVLDHDAVRFTAPEGGLRYFAYGGDYGDKPNDENFCFNGIVQPDLAPNPHAVEIAHQYRSILTTGSDLAADRPRVRVLNENFFVPLRDQPLRWTLREDGRAIRDGELIIAELAPQAVAELEIPLPALARRPGAEYHLELEYPQSHDKPWAKAGHVLARDQLLLDWQKPAEPAAWSGRAEDIAVATADDGAVILSGRAATVVIDTRSGRVSSYRVAGREMLKRPLGPDFWRAPTDNDRGAKLHERLGVWREAGEKARVLETTREAAADRVRVTCELAIPVGETRATVSYELRSDGALRVAFVLRPAGDKLPEIPTIALQGALAPALREWTWFGRGPEENYSDRAEGTLVGLWSGSVDKLWWPYGRPQETANRGAVRWASFTDAEGRGLRIRADDGQHLEIAAWPFLRTDLEGLRHPADIPARDLVGLRVAHRVMGVGGENSWGTWPRPAHLIRADREHAYAFVIEPLAP